MALYSDSSVDLEIVCCFFDFQETRETLIKIQNPVIDLIVLGQEAQYASAKPFNTGELKELKNKPCPTVPFIYCNTQFRAFICGSFGLSKNRLK